MARPTPEQQETIDSVSKRGKAQGMFYVRRGLDFDARTNGMVWVSCSAEDILLLLDKAERLDAIEAEQNPQGHLPNE